eukprot:388453-Pelagomonas_calceolata.AAC.4
MSRPGMRLACITHQYERAKEAPRLRHPVSPTQADQGSAPLVSPSFTEASRPGKRLTCITLSHQDRRTKRATSSLQNCR